MATRKKKPNLLAAWRRVRLKRLKSNLQYKEKKLELRATVQKNSHSLLWVWEFSKKAVLICFIFYVIVQVYSMVVMVRFLDFTYLGELISQTAQLTERCVFAYLIKAGLENVGKIWFQNKRGGDTRNDDNADGPVG